MAATKLKSSIANSKNDVPSIQEAWVPGPTGVPQAPAPKEWRPGEFEATSIPAVPGNRAARVDAFHRKFGYPVRRTPTLPTADELRFRLKLNVEESMVEVLEACFAPGPELDMAREALRDLLERGRLSVCMRDLVDALEDSDYVTEGFRASLGVDGEPFARLVHAANMAKSPPDRDDPNSTGKAIKPRGWQPPDVAGELRRQGFDRDPLARLVPPEKP